MGELTYEHLGQAYRDAEERIKARQAECDEACKADRELMDKCLAGAHAMMLQDERKNAKTPYGTFYLEQWRAPKMEDKQAFWEWIRDNDRHDMLPGTPLKSPVLEYVDNQGPVPGIRVDAGWKAKMRKT